jgi:hypothetical protein
MKILYVCNNSNLTEHLYERVKRINNEYIFLLDTPFIEDEKIIHGSFDDTPCSIWKFIIQNNIFEDEDYICIVEYSEKFLNNIEYLNANYSKYDIISFEESSNESFFHGINQNTLESYLKEHNLYIPDVWWPTMYHCMNRNLMCEFINFYEYTCGELDPSKILSCYSKQWNRKVLNKTTYALCYDTSSDTSSESSELIESINHYSPETEIICCSFHEVTVKYWKPYIIYKVLSELEAPSTLLYIGNNYRFDKDYLQLYENLSYIKAWKSNQFINQEYIEKMLYECKITNCNSIELFNTDLILFDTKEETIKIVKQWLDLCEHFSHISDEVPNYIDILFSIIIKTYTS